MSLVDDSIETCEVLYYTTQEDRQDGLSDDEAHALGAICARICALAGSRDLTAWMEEDEGGKRSSAWDIICALAERGRLGYKEEELVSSGLFLLS